MMARVRRRSAFPYLGAGKKRGARGPYQEVTEPELGAAAYLLFQMAKRCAKPFGIGVGDGIDTIDSQSVSYEATRNQVSR